MNIRNELITETIARYLEHLPEPQKNDHPYIFAERSYIKWAVGELLLQIMDHPFSDALDTIELFALQMNDYSNLKSGSEQCRPFIIARDTAYDILRMFL